MEYPVAILLTNAKMNDSIWRGNFRKIIMNFDVATITAQVTAVIAELEKNPSGGGEGLAFFNIKNTEFHAELHTRNGQLVYLGLYSNAELEFRQRTQEILNGDTWL